MLSDSYIVTNTVIAAATTDEEVWLGMPACYEGSYRVIECGAVPNTTAAANGTNYATLTFTGSDGSTALGTLTTASTALTAGTRRKINPSGSAAVFSASATSVNGVKVNKTHSGSGVAVDTEVYAVFEKIRA